MGDSELIQGYRELPENYHNHHHCTTTTTTTTSIANTPSLQKSEDAADGVLFKMGLHPSSPTTTSIKAQGRWRGREDTPKSAEENGVLGTPLGKQQDPSLIPPPGVHIKLYLRRFWILGTFSFMAMFQCLMWNTWGPLSASMNAAYPGWGSDTVAMMGNWGTITFVCFVAPMCWLMHAKGVRVGVVVCGALVAAGVVVRVLPLLFPLHNDTDAATFFTVMCHVCAVFVGTAGTLVMAAPPMIAAVWFPPNERTTATAFSQMSNILGNAGSYLEPLAVREPSSSNPDAEEIDAIRNDVKRLMYIWAGVGVAMFITLLVYFPAKPPSPPSLTSHVERLNFRESLKMMARNRDVLLVTVSYGMALGAPSAWASVLNYSLYELGMSQKEAMWVGLADVLGSSCVGLLAARLTDVIYGYIKLSLIMCLAFGIVFFYWFFLLTWGSIPVTTWQIFVTVVGGMAFNSSMPPLFFELAVENAYPCSEIVVGGLLTAANNLVGIVFLFLFFVPFSSYQWITYVLLATQALALIPLAFVKEDYSRSSIDRTNMHSADDSK